MPNQVNKEEWADWLLHPTTKVFREVLRHRREALKEQWASGDFTHEGEFATGLSQGRAVGAAQTFADLLALDEVQVNQELNDE